MSGQECERCQALRDEVKFWREQQKLAADMVAGLADLNDHDQRVASLRKLLRGERERRHKVEREATVLAYKLAEATGTLP
ncbi:hypothetical protein AB0M54_24390 [Actinoplanes sp. NPDC051470]|uniref:hypothetical protein n=1 Tax=Actinoplanes sp. NPDC051470 TaxID=3157224 RepID=UPI00343818BE